MRSCAWEGASGQDKHMGVSVQLAQARKFKARITNWQSLLQRSAKPREARRVAMTDRDWKHRKFCNANGEIGRRPDSFGKVVREGLIVFCVSINTSLVLETPADPANCEPLFQLFFSPLHCASIRACRATCEFVRESEANNKASLHKVIVRTS